MTKRTRNIFLKCHGDERGQAIFIGLFYFLLLAALAFLILNSGDTTNNKVAMQISADATTLTGSDWYCRGLNTIAMCNVTQTQILSVIVLLDSMETTVPASKKIIDDLLSNLARTPAGGDVPNDSRLSNWLVVGNAREEQQMLQTLSNLMSRVPMNEYCHYDDGVLWQCCYVLNELAGQMAMITPEMCQREAGNVGRKDGAQTAFVLPFYPALPINPIDNSGASFANFKRPMAEGRQPNGRRINGYRDLQNYNSRVNGAAMGPFAFMREPFVNPTPMGLFELSRFSILFQIVSDKKLEMLFGSPDPRICLTSRIESYSDLLDFVSKNGANKVLNTYWTTQSFDTLGDYGTPSFFQTVGVRSPQYPRESQRQPTTGFIPAPAGYTRATRSDEGADPREDLYYKSTLSMSPWYPQLGIFPSHPPPFAPGEGQPYYAVSLWRFDGAEVSLDTTLDRKYLPPAGRPPKLAPIMLTQAASSRRNTTNIFNNFSFVGFAFIPGNSTVWPKIFANPLPTEGKLICYAQSTVYNDCSWDLFTQAWRSRLVRLDHWAWADSAVSQGPGSTAAQNYVSANDLTPVEEMLNMYDETYVNLITH